jgi:hypothetical protein
MAPAIATLVVKADCQGNLHRRIIPDIKPDSRGRNTPKRGRKRLFNPAIIEGRFNTIERPLGQEDKFRSLLLSYAGTLQHG